MHLTPRGVRIGILVALAGPVSVILLTNGLHAQFQPPPQPKIQPPPPIQPPPIQPPKIQPPPPIQVPQFEQVWTCGKCGKVMGNGAFPPGTCPHCGVKIINGIDKGGAPPNPINPIQPVQEPSSRGSLMIGLIVGGVAIVVVALGVVGVAVYLTSGQSKPKKSGKRRRKRPVREDDDDE